MAKILILGSSPLPFMNAKRLYGPGIRTWQFAVPLLNAGHEVRIIAAQVPDSRTKGPPLPVHGVPNLSLTFMEQADFDNIAPVAHAMQNYEPDAIVAAGYGASRVAVGLDREMPIWADFFGDPMAEAQALAEVCGNDDKIYQIWSYVAPVLDRADRFSAVSERQKYAVIGQLASRGRLNRWTHRYDFVSCIPCALAPMQTLPVAKRMRGRLFPQEAFVVLWSGGYNTWADAESLFFALQWAMQRNPRIHFVSTGGQIDGHDEITYPGFLRRVEASDFKDRFHLLGWVETFDVRGLYAECDLAVNVDRPCYEGLLGSRNRILDWMDAGLPVLTTETCELSAILRERELGFVVQPGDQETLGQEILRLSLETDLLRERAERASAYAREHFTFEATTRAVRDWAQHPEPAPDRGRFPTLGGAWTFKFYGTQRRIDNLRQVAKARGWLAVLGIVLRGTLRRMFFWIKVRR